MAYFPMALCNVFLGPWLWLANGMTDAQTPNIMHGCISQCVYLLSNLSP